jgi:hypothetical protein
MIHQQIVKIGASLAILSRNGSIGQDTECHNTKTMTSYLSIGSKCPKDIGCSGNESSHGTFWYKDGLFNRMMTKHEINLGRTKGCSAEHVKTDTQDETKGLVVSIHQRHDLFYIGIVLREDHLDKGKIRSHHSQTGERILIHHRVQKIFAFHLPIKGRKETTNHAAKNHTMIGSKGTIKTNGNTRLHLFLFIFLE